MHLDSTCSNRTWIWVSNLTFLYLIPFFDNNTAPLLFSRLIPLTLLTIHILYWRYLFGRVLDIIINIVNISIDLFYVLKNIYSFYIISWLLMFGWVATQVISGRWCFLKIGFGVYFWMVILIASIEGCMFWLYKAWSLLTWTLIDLWFL